MPSRSRVEAGGPGPLPEDLNTPTLAALAATPPFLTRTDTPTSGLFDPLGLSTTVQPDPGSLQTTARALDLATLDPRELDSLLADLEPGHPKMTAPGTPVPVLSPPGDHDYCEDWTVLQEFIDVPVPRLQHQDSEQLASLCSQLLDTPAEPGSLAPEGLGPGFLDGLTDLEPILLGSISLGIQDVAQPIHLGSIAVDSLEEDVELADPEYLPKPLRLRKPSAQSYRERRTKNNRASAASRRTRKEKRLALEAERDALAQRNGDLQAELTRLEALTKEWKGRLLHLIG